MPPYTFWVFICPNTNGDSYDNKKERTYVRSFLCVGSFVYIEKIQKIAKRL